MATEFNAPTIKSPSVTDNSIKPLRTPFPVVSLAEIFAFIIKSPANVFNTTLPLLAFTAKLSASKSATVNPPDELTCKSPSPAIDTSTIVLLTLMTKF